jgi:hypothetical protein
VGVVRQAPASEGRQGPRPQRRGRRSNRQENLILQL